MVPNHLFQILALVGMESPGSFEADAVRDEKGQTPEGDSTVGRRKMSCRSRFAANITQVKLQAVPYWVYRNSPNVAADSNTETFAAFKLLIDNWRWGGRPLLFADRQSTFTAS